MSGATRSDIHHENIVVIIIVVFVLCLSRGQIQIMKNATGSLIHLAFSSSHGLCALTFVIGHSHAVTSDDEYEYESSHVT
jgi:hypothetical protein